LTAGVDAVAGVAVAVELAVSLFVEAVALALESAGAVALAVESAEAVALSSFKFNLVLLFTYTRVAFLEALEVV
jgi:hypothetical protein